MAHRVLVAIAYAMRVTTWLIIALLTLLLVSDLLLLVTSPQAVSQGRWLAFLVAAVFRVLGIAIFALAYVGLKRLTARLRRKKVVPAAA